jgi:hypothetical protein
MAIRLAAPQHIQVEVDGEWRCPFSLLGKAMYHVEALAQACKRTDRECCRNYWCAGDVLFDAHESMVAAGAGLLDLVNTS